MRLGIAIIAGSPWSEMVERARTVEQAGFDVLMTGDHLRHPFDADAEFIDGWSVLAGWAAVSERIRLSMLVSNVIYRNPAVLANQAIAVDHISRGRLDLGIGSGLFETDHAMAGVPPWSVDERIGRTEEVVDIVDRLLRGNTDDFAGRWYSVKQAAVAPGPVQEPRPPIVIGANHPRMLRLAARRADVWNTWGGYGLDEDGFIAHTRERIGLIEHACDSIGRDPATLGRSVLVHHGAFQPWRSIADFERIVTTFAAMGFQECLFYWPQPHERAVFDRVVTEVLESTLRLRSPAATVRAYVERLLNDGDFAAAGDILDEHFHGQEPAGPVESAADLVANVRRWRDAFPNARFAADDLVVEGDRVAWTWRLAANHVSGRSVDVSGVIVFTVRNGRIVSYRGFYDRGALAAQIGADAV